MLLRDVKSKLDRLLSDLCPLMYSKKIASLWKLKLYNCDLNIMPDSTFGFFSLLNCMYAIRCMNSAMKI